MRFFKSKLSQDLFFNPVNRTIYFVSSEEGPDDVRLYTVRSYKPDTGEIDNASDFQQYETLAKAKSAAKHLLEGVNNGQ
jgi:hypothetical protein